MLFVRNSRCLPLTLVYLLTYLLLKHQELFLIFHELTAIDGINDRRTPYGGTMGRLAIQTGPG